MPRTFLIDTDTASDDAVALIMAQGQDPSGLGLYRLQRADGSYQVMEVNAGRFPLSGEMGGFWFVARRPRRSEIYTAALHAVLEDRPLSEALGKIPELLPSIGERFCITGSVEGGPTFTVGDRLPPVQRPVDGVADRNRTNDLDIQFDCRE